MGQDIRSRLVARDALCPQPRTEAELPAPLQIRRFSEGLERAVLDRLRRPLPGRYSRGAKRLPEDKQHIGRYSDGLDQRPDDAPSRVHLGRFSQGIDHGEG